MGKSSRIGLILLICFMLKTTSNCYAQKFSKYEIKAAYVHNFIKFVQWPEGKTQVRLGIIGKNEFTGVLKNKLFNQKIGKYTVKITHYTSVNTIENCDVLFVANDSLIDSKIVLEKLENKSILTIGEDPLFFKNNGMISFEERDEGNFVFLINNSIALKEKIIISSKLLKLAFKIR